jgi:tetratricopeptide (TPR) repeat protein
MHNHFLYCIRTGQFEEARHTLPEHFKKIKSFNTKVFDDHHFLFHYAYIYFGSGDYDEALYHLNNWLDMPSTIDNPKLQMLSRVFNLILHYELGNILLVSSLIKSTYRFLKKENQLDEIEKAFLNFIKTVIKAQGKREVKECFQKFKTSLMNITDSEEATISVFDLMSWVDSKLINMSFEEIVKNKWEKTKVGIS